MLLGEREGKVGRGGNKSSPIDLGTFFASHRLRHEDATKNERANLFGVTIIS